MANRNTILKNSIDGFLARRGMSRSRFGLETAGNPSLVARIAAGRVIRLDSADRILAYMGKEPFGPAFRREVEAFIAITGTKASLLGHEAVGDPSFARRLRHGASPSLDTCDRVSAWMESQSSEAERLAVRATVEICVPAVPAGSGKQREAEMDDDAIYMGTRELAALLGLSPRTLDRYRVSGGGPKFYKFGNRVRYARADVEAWAAERRYSSTSDAGGLACETA